MIRNHRNNGDDGMKKNNDILIKAIRILIVVIVMTVVVILSVRIIDIEQNIREVTDFIATLIFLSSCVGLFMCAMLYIIIRGMKNVSSCKVTAFKEIDRYKILGSLDDNKYYSQQIKIINKNYKNGGIVDDLVRNKDILTLYLRADYLNTQDEFFSDVKTCIAAMVISVLAAFYVGVDEIMDTSLGKTMMIVAIVLIFLATIMFNYFSNGRYGSLVYLVNNHERKLLNEKIVELEKNLVMHQDDEQLLETSLFVFDELNEIWRRKHGKARKALAKDISKIKELNLCVDDGENYFIRNIMINEKMCHLVYVLDKGKENDYKGEKNLYNKDYEELYEILNKHNLISSWSPIG